MHKTVLGLYGNDQGHWVGDGFPVRSLFSYSDFGKQLSPFLLLDYAGPHEFTPTQTRRGVGEHPHKGFETVTIVYDGEVEHRDSSGGGGVIGPGDVQWMTAGNGILHQEFHFAAYAGKGDPFRMVQLWVNLLAKDKGTPASYQTITAADIPEVALPDQAGRLRVIAGEYESTKGPARIFSPLNVWDGVLHEGAQVTMPLPEGHNAAVICLEGELAVGDKEKAGSAKFVLLGTEGHSVPLRAGTETSFLVLTGQPLNEPIAGYGPFVMNTQDEIRAAIDEFRAGKFGGIPAA
ncbi:pirin family protein [Acetobacter sp. AN02]|uniref:pirin family protein n=1 Tax=Acetobacter sp. AN02 TaxID=2894186 RepID=UPI002434108E|nr:pirin family protein [Acetobacter sp. AN02]MDG6093556.1 pirin family protein [Acetobacter sp. AN02]